MYKIVRNLYVHCRYDRFLSMLEEEVYGTNSPIWDPEFSQNAANMAGSPPDTRMYLSYF